MCVCSCSMQCHTHVCEPCGTMVRLDGSLNEVLHAGKGVDLQHPYLALRKRAYHSCRRAGTKRGSVSFGRSLWLGGQGSIRQQAQERNPARHGSRQGHSSQAPSKRPGSEKIAANRRRARSRHWQRPICHPWPQPPKTRPRSPKTLHSPDSCCAAARSWSRAALIVLRCSRGK